MKSRTLPNGVKLFGGDENLLRILEETVPIRAEDDKRFD